MNNHTPHFDDAELRRLVIDDDDDSDDFLAAAAHVETCVDCQQRLLGLSASDEFADEASYLIRGYPPDEQDHAPLSGTDVQLDFLGPPGHPEMLGRLGRYEIEQVIGAGGMGIVLKGFDSELNRPVAIKVLAQHLAHRGPARRRFAREAKAAAAVVHEHVVAIHNVEADGDLPFLVMQFIAGESLQARVDRDGPLETREVLRIGIQTAAGLAAAHEQGVIHRDIKPANILLENGVERVLITDFGLARTIDDASLTHTGVVAGTPHYMSPEQANGQAADERTDLFSLGSVLYFMVTGHPPFRAERAMGVLNRICHDRHRPAWQVNSDVPDELSDLIDRLLQKKPSKRFAGAGEVREALALLLVQLQQGSRRRPRLAGWFRRNRALARALFGGAGAVVLAMALLWFRSPPESGAPENSGLPRAGAATPGTPSTSLAGSAAIEADALSEGAQSLEQRLDVFEATSDSALFARHTADDFAQQVQSLNRRLDQVENDSFAQAHDFPR